MVTNEQIQQQLNHLGIVSAQAEDAFALSILKTELSDSQQDKWVVLYCQENEGLIVLAIDEDRISEHIPTVIPLKMIYQLEVKKGLLKDYVQFEWDEQLMQFTIPHRVKHAKWQNDARKKLLHLLHSL